jgi:uncharacterized membrane protein (GlpM family)
MTNIQLLIVIFIPTFAVIIGVLVNNQAINALRTDVAKDFSDIRELNRYFINVFINHTEDISALKERTRPK